MENNLEVRLARTEDKSAIVAFCQNTFSWGDYIADVFDLWSNDPEGKLLVGLIDHRPVGILHILFLENDVAWLEGMRVHPDYRRQKIGTILDSAAREVARENHCRVEQLVTSMKNIAAQKTLDTEGYQRVAQFNEWETTPTPRLGESTPLEIGTDENIDQVLKIWNDSEIRQASRAVIPNRHWHWKPLHEQRLQKIIAAKELRVTPNGFAIATHIQEKDWSGLTMYALAGEAEDMYEIARDIRSEAALLGCEHVEATLADYAPLNEAMTRAGYTTDGGLYLYEQGL